MVSLTLAMLLFSFTQGYFNPLGQLSGVLYSVGDTLDGALGSRSGAFANGEVIKLEDGRTAIIPNENAVAAAGGLGSLLNGLGLKSSSTESADGLKLLPGIPMLG